jgi:hypothetical protein
MVTTLASGSGSTSAATLKCVSTHLQAKYRSSGQLVAALNSGRAAQVSATFTTCLPSDQVEQQLIQSMVNGGYTTDEATCVVKKVLSEVKPSQFSGTAGADLPADVKSKIVAAAKNCSPTS